MILVTGGAGFIGSNVVAALERRGFQDIVVSDDLTDGRKFRNLVERRIREYWDKDECLSRLSAGPPPAAVIHQGACTDTTEWDGKRMLKDNYGFSRDLLAYCTAARVPLVYASSAAVYGLEPGFAEEARCERPLNVYGYSKLLFDQHVRRALPQASSQIVGLRYFNVYGPGESGKGAMASVAWHFREQLLATGGVRLFAGSHGCRDGEQRRDFVYVDDVVEVVLWFLDHPDRRGIFNVGTGRSRSFNDVARALLSWRGSGRIEYVPFPAHLDGHYQAFTEADLGRLRAVGCDVAMRDVAEGVRDYMARLDAGD